MQSKTITYNNIENIFPKHWEKKRIKQIFYEIDERSSTGKEDLLSVSQYSGITLKKENVLENEFITNAKTLVNYKKVKKNDLIINIMLAWNGSLGISKYDGITSPAYCVYRTYSDYSVDFFGYLFSTKLFLNEFKKNSYGIIDSRLRMYSNNFFNINTFFPPFEEQVKIANYLDVKCEQINQFITDKKQLINLLKEQRQSVIDRAVTKGIDNNVEFIESQYSFLPAYPKSWKVMRLGAIGTFSKGGNISRANLLSGVKDTNAILYGDIYTKYDIKVTDVINQIKSSVAKNAIKIEYDDLLFTGSGETKEDIGKCIVNKCKEDVYAGGDVIIFKQSIFDSHFLAYSQNSSFAKYQKSISSKGDIIVHQYGSKLKNVLMPYPSIEEQKIIVNYIMEETKIIDETIAKTEEELKLVTEYKEALISNAVTGQIQLT